MKSIRIWLLFLIFLLPFQIMAGPYEEGSEYKRLASSQPVSVEGKTEVIEIFWYKCPHCFQLEPYVEKWLEQKPDDIVFIRLPITLKKRPSDQYAKGELMARAYYTAEALGILDKIHVPLFDAIHEKKQKINNESALQDFFIEQGVSKTDFANTFRSFVVDAKLRNAIQIINSLGVRSVPTLIINGKFKTGSREAGGSENIMKVVEHLIKQEQTQNAASKAPDR